MATLLTTERAAVLLSMPKRLVRDSELAWKYAPPPIPSLRPGRKKKGVRVQNAYLLKARLIEIGGREGFLLTGTKNGSFSYTLKWGGFDLARIDCGRRHRIQRIGEPDRFVHGPHVHVYVAGEGLNNAYETDQYSYDDPVAALAFFLRHCNVVNPPDLQEVLRLG